MQIQAFDQNTIDNALSGQKHHRRKRGGEYNILARVQICQRRRNLERRGLVRLQVLVILGNLIGFVVEMLLIVSAVPEHALK